MTDRRPPHARMSPARARWATGFWADRFRLCRDAVLPTVRDALRHGKNSAQLSNFAVAAGFAPGAHRGTDWSDGDCYKWLEALAYVYGETRDPALDAELDEWIRVIAAAQDGDGYLCTQIQLTGKARWSRRVHHELYDFGHLFTAACAHHAATGKRSFLDVAVKAADYLGKVFAPRPKELAMFGWNPSNIMGLVDLYRATGVKRYLDLAGVFVDMRGTGPFGYPTAVEPDPGDQNQNTRPLREESLAVGHAVTATYLYAGATDLCAETGEAGLLAALERIWQDMVGRKMYITGAIGTLDRGCSERGHTVHEAFGRPYQLPSGGAYNETCANFGNAMWNWRLLQLTGDARYGDVMERALYNSGLSGMSVDGRRFCYTNPLRWHGEAHPWRNRDAPGRWFLHDCYCCPPQMARTLAGMHRWAAGASDDGVWLHLYGGCEVAADLPGGTVRLTQETDYPWDGDVRVTVDEAPARPFALHLRIPGWAFGVTVAGNGAPADAEPRPGAYLALRRSWRPGDRVDLALPLPVQVMEAHPFVEACRNQVAVMRGPVVYCLESVDLPDGVAIDDLSLCLDRPMATERRPDLLGGVTVIHAPMVHRRSPRWTGALYRPRTTSPGHTLNVPLIPYFAWRNRGEGEMSVWLPAVSQT